MFSVSSQPTQRFLASQSWFVALPAQQQAAITAQVFTLTAPRGQTILPAHERTQGWYQRGQSLIKDLDAVRGDAAPTFWASLPETGLAKARC